MVDDHEVDWGNDEDDLFPSKSFSGSTGMSHDTGGELDDVEDAVSLGGDEEEEFAAYGARPDEQNTPPTDKPQTSPPKKDVGRRSASVSVAPKKGARQAHPIPHPPSPQPEIRQPTSKLTHALPPKPVVTSSFRVPPSTTAASPMSLPRKERRPNGNSANTSDEPALSDREPRNVVRETRHRESHPDESSWTRPGSNAPDLSSLPQDRTKSFDDRDSRPSSRRDDDCYRPSHRRAHYSSDEEGKESSSHLVPSRNDMGYRHDDRDKRQNYASSDRNDKPTTRTARLSPEDESLDRARPGYRESNASDTRRVLTRDRDVSPVRDDSSRRVPRRGDYPDYDSIDKGPRVFDDPPRRGTGTADRARYPEAINVRTNSVSSREPYAQNQGPGRSPTFRRNPPSPRPRSRSPIYNRRDDRGATPPRYQEYPSDSRISHDRGRAESPPSRPRVADRLIRHDALVDLPQRRPRAVSDTRDPDYSVKRRKTEDRDGNPPLMRRALVGPDTYTPQETSTVSTSPRSTGALDDLSRPRRREPLPSQSLRYKEASSDQSHRRPVNGSNRVMPHPQTTAPSQRHHPAVLREQDVLQPRHPDTNVGKPDRPRRGSGHDLVHPYPDKFRRDDHMDVDPPYLSRASQQYEEPARLRELGNRSSSHADVVIREAAPPTPRSRRRNSFNARPTPPVGPTPIITEKIRGRSRDRSPRTYHEPRRTSLLTSSASAPLSMMPPRPPRDTQFVEDYRHHERRVDRDREVHSPTLPRNSSNAVAPRSQPSGRYDEPRGQGPPRSPELRPTPPQEQTRHQVSNLPSTRRERQAPPISEPKETPIRARGDSTSRRDSPQERPSRLSPAPDANFPPPPLPVHTSRDRPLRKPVQPEFMLSLPPPSTRLPGAPPPPLLPPHLYGSSQDESMNPRSLPNDENGSAKVESDPDHMSPLDRFRPLPTSPIQQTKEGPRPQQAQETRQEPAQVQPLGNSLPSPVDGGNEENTRFGRHILSPAEERRPSVQSDDRQTKPASWDRPRNSHPKPMTLPASLPPKPVAAVVELSTSLRTGNPGRGRRTQQPPGEGSGHGPRWGTAPRRDEGGDLNDRERNNNRWTPHSEYRAPPPLLARMSSNDSLGRTALEIHERGGGESQRKKARTKKFAGV